MAKKKCQRVNSCKLLCLLILNPSIYKKMVLCLFGNKTLKVLTSLFYPLLQLPSKSIKLSLNAKLFYHFSNYLPILNCYFSFCGSVSSDSNLLACPGNQMSPNEDITFFFQALHFSYSTFH